MNEQLELLGANDVTDDMIAEHGAPYRPGTSFGYCHAPTQLVELGLSDAALVLFFRMLVDESRGTETPEAFFANPDAVGQLIDRRMIEPDGDDWRIFEPELWEAGE